jgi:hypothetical protein
MIKLSQMPPHWREARRRERDDGRRAAAVFARVCREGDADNLYDAALFLDEQVNAWRPAMAKVAALGSVSPEIQAAFQPIWIERKMLPLTVGHRPTMAAALRVLMPPGTYRGPPLTLYRGTSTYERKRRLYGFSWSVELDSARGFAEHWTGVGEALVKIMPSSATSGIILKTVAPPEAVLLIREPEEYYDEGEVVVDPYRLGKVTPVPTAQQVSSG